MLRLLVVIGLIFLGVMMFQEFAKIQPSQFAVEQYREYWILAPDSLVEIDRIDTQRIIGKYPLVETSVVSATINQKTSLQPVAGLD